MTLDEQCARALGWEEREIPFLVDDNDVTLTTMLAWYDAAGEARGVPPAFSTDTTTTPLLLAEIARRGLLIAYTWELYNMLGQFVSTEGGYISIDDVVVMLSATPEQHARAFVKVTND